MIDGIMNFIKAECHKLPKVENVMIMEYILLKFYCSRNKKSKNCSNVETSMNGKVWMRPMPRATRTSTSLWGEWMGVMHGDEMEYVFGHPLNMSLQYHTRERDLAAHIMQSFTRFALTGKPNKPDEKWSLYSRSSPHYYTYTADGPSGMAGPRGPRASACAFWNDFLNKLNEMENKPCDRAVTGPYSSVAGTSLPIILLTALATTVAL